MADIYYQINEGAEKIVSEDGKPQITTEKENNSLEFWSVDIAGNVEDVQLISGIKLDKTNPIVGNIVIALDSEIHENQSVQVFVDVSDAVSGIDEVTLSYSTDNLLTWQNVSMVLNTTSDLWQATIPGQQIWTNVNYKVTAYDVAGNSASTETQTSSYEVIPEFPSWLFMPLFLVVGVVVVAFRWKVFRPT